MFQIPYIVCQLSADYGNCQEITVYRGINHGWIVIRWTGEQWVVRTITWG